MLKDIDLTIFDDSGILSIVDCSAYKSFLSENWDYESIFAHFKAQMNLRSILVWECGDGGGPYLVQVSGYLSKKIGFREVTGCIEAKSGRLNFVSYDALTMAAQFEDELLPSNHEATLAIDVLPGTYKIRILQMFDPMKVESIPDGTPHFLIEIISGVCPPWGEAAWISQ
jgi:hypothetical protein